MAKEPKSNDSIWTLVKPYYWVLKFFGLGVFSIDGDINNGRIKTRFYDVISTCIALVFQTYVLYINITFDLSLSRTSSFLIDKGAHLIEIFNACNVIAGSLLFGFHRKRIWGILRKCHEFDVEMKRFGIDVNRQINRILLVSSLAMSLLLILMMAVTLFVIPTIVKPELEVYFWISNLSSNIYSTLFLLGFIFMLIALHRRFDSINECLRSNFKTEEEEPEMVYDKKKNAAEKLIMKLADLHDSLNECVVEINVCFSFVTMMTYASAFMLNIFSTFAIYRIFVRENYNFITEAVVQSSWNLYFYVYCFITITLCSLVTRTGKFSAILCHKAINYSHDDSIIDHLKFFSQQMRHRSPVVSCGLFTFDFTLMFTILGATATYIVILIQFDSSPNDAELHKAVNVTM